jgi:RimJ/RimL family protein N-acetyltransferase
VADTTTGFAAKPTLRGERVVLRPFEPEDAPPLSAALRDPELLRLTGSVHAPGELPTLSAEKAEEFRVWRNTQPDRLDLAVVEAATGRCVGEVVFNDWDPDNSSCNFRTWLAPEGQNRGLGTDALRTFLAYGFEHVGLNRVSLEVYAFNPRARRVYDKVGFVTEGVLRQALRYDGEWIDAVVMSILAPEWTRHRGRPGESLTR